MARYAITRERNLRGLGATYFFTARRGMRGLGQTTDIDVVTGLPCDDPRANCGPFIPTTTIPAPPVLVEPAPIPFPPIAVPPPMTTAPPPTPPSLTLPPPVTGPMPTFVFPSGGTITTPTAPPVGWMDQQILSGVPNKFLALGMVLLGIAAAAGGQGRRR